MRKISNVFMALTALLAISVPISANADDQTLPEKVRQANDRFNDVEVAISEGYVPIPCTSGVDGGAMGVHYVNAALIADHVIDIAKPEAVMYEPDADGKLHLVAAEYITTTGPVDLEDQLFSYSSSPNRYGLPAFYELHVWAWKKNPKGPFADMNPDVSCEHHHPTAH